MFPKAVIALLGATVVSLARAQADGAPSNAQAIQVTPRVNISERYTNNARLVGVGKQSELITQVSPGINILSNTGRIKGSLDYSLNGFQYARDTSADHLQNALTTSFLVEAVESLAYLDIRGNISQQAISAFGTRSADSQTRNANTTEVSLFSISPYLRGTFAGSIDYDARLDFSTTRADSNAASNLTTRGGRLVLNSRINGVVGWGMNLGRSRTTYSLGRSIESDQITGDITYAVSPQLNLSLTAGREFSNYETLNQRGSATYSFGLNWSPSQRTKLAAQFGRKPFGNSHNLSFEHRTGRTSWRFSDSRSLSNSPSNSGSTAIGSLVDLVSSQFERLEPDPLKRAELVSNFLLVNGLDPNARVLSNFLTSSVSLQRRQELSFAVAGVRDTVSFSLSRGTNSKLDNVVTAFDDFSSNGVVRQSGYALTYLHRLTPDANVSVVISRQDTSGSVGQTGTSLRAFDVVLSSRLGKQTYTSFGTRRAFFDSALPYSETSFIGSLNMQF